MRTTTQTPANRDAEPAIVAVHVLMHSDWEMKNTHK